MEQQRVRIVVLGGGFGGLTFCQAFRHPRAEITLVDRQNHHLFQPLLYQVATAGLSAPEIAQPIRSILNECPNVTVRLDEVVAIDLGKRRVQLKSICLDFDYLVIALGGVTSYFGHPEWEAFAPGLKSLEDAQRIRRELLLAFERAENEPDPEVRKRLMSIAVVGAGPTGIELAGACAELTRHVLRSDFRTIDPGQAKVTLIEGGPRVLPQFPEHLAENAAETLRTMGVDVRVSTRVKTISKGRIELVGGEVIEAENILWAAGVGASPVAQSLGVALDRAGRIPVAPDLSIPGHPQVFAIGDLAAVVDAEGKSVPGVSPAAIQEAQFVARLIVEELDGTSERGTFEYWDKGSMATIGRSAAVAKMGSLEFTGFLAWLSWLGVHLVFLIGFRNRLAVLLQWAYSYFTYKRGARIITGLKRE